MNKDRSPLAPRPTDAELSILKVLWEKGPSTVRQVMECLCQERPTGYTTVLKLMQIMTEKKQVQRDESQRSHVYRAAFTQGQTQCQLIGDPLDRAFAGSAVHDKALTGIEDGATVVQPDIGDLRGRREGKGRG